MVKLYCSRVTIVPHFLTYNTELGVPPALSLKVTCEHENSFYSDWLPYSKIKLLKIVMILGSI